MNAKNINDNLDSLLEAAIREKGAVLHMKDLERKNAATMARRVAMKVTCYVAAAILVLGAVFSWKLSSDVRKVGYTFDPVAGQRGGSEISALMQEGNIPAARLKIRERRESLQGELLSPTTDNREYIAQMEADLQELDLLDAVCLMRQGKFLHARRALRRIKDSGGPFASTASELLEKL